jgi:hypothetical protein
LQLVEEHPCTLIAGANACLRAAVRLELAAVMAPDARFGEAERVSEVLEQAHRSGVVMLTGDLQDASADALIKLLAQRHPRLPIVALDAPLIEREMRRTAAGSAETIPTDLQRH